MLVLGLGLGRVMLGRVLVTQLSCSSGQEWVAALYAEQMERDAKALTAATTTEAGAWSGRIEVISNVDCVRVQSMHPRVCVCVCVCMSLVAELRVVSSCPQAKHSTDAHVSSTAPHRPATLLRRCAPDDCPGVCLSMDPSTTLSPYPAAKESLFTMPSGRVMLMQCVECPQSNCTMLHPCRC